MRQSRHLVAGVYAVRIRNSHIHQSEQRRLRMTLWSDDKTNEDIQKLSETDSDYVVYNLHEDLLRVKEQLAKANEDYKALFSAFESCQGELKESNERVKRLEKILQRYEYEQLKPLKLRVKELESAILDSCSTYHFEPDLSQPVSSLNELLIINSKWTLDPEISSDAKKFAIKQQIKGLKDYQALCGYSDSRKFIDARIAQLEEQLRKEQE